VLACVPGVDLLALVDDPACRRESTWTGPSLSCTPRLPSTRRGRRPPVGVRAQAHQRPRPLLVPAARPRRYLAPATRPDHTPTLTMTTDPRRRRRVAATIEVINDREKVLAQGRFSTDRDGHQTMLKLGRQQKDRARCVPRRHAYRRSWRADRGRVLRHPARTRPLQRNRLGRLTFELPHTSACTSWNELA